MFRLLLRLQNVTYVPNIEIGYNSVTITDIY
jgi:hypothetical protein